MESNEVPDWSELIQIQQRRIVKIVIGRIPWIEQDYNQCEYIKMIKGPS